MIGKDPVHHTMALPLKGNKGVWKIMFLFNNKILDSILEKTEDIIKKLNILEAGSHENGSSIRELAVKMEDEPNRCHILGDSLKQRIDVCDEKLSLNIEKGFDRLSGIQENMDVTLSDILEELESINGKRDHATEIIDGLKDENSGLVTLVMEMIELMFYSRAQSNCLSTGVEEEDLLGRYVQMADKAGLKTIASVGTDIDYDRHRVEAVISADEGHSAGTVALVHSPGFEYKGRIFKKAVVSVYN